LVSVNYPAAAAGPEGLPPGHEPFRGGAWPGGSCGALKFKTYFHVVIPAKLVLDLIGEQESRV